jgi:MFS superfamily sulfate permease-like transporter
VIFAIGAVTLFLLFFITGILARIQQPWSKFIPVPLVVIAMAGTTAWFLGLEEKFLIHVPRVRPTCLSEAAPSGPTSIMRSFN